MIHLQEFGTLIGAYSFLTLLCFIAFGIAIRFRSLNIAPKAHGRSKNVIYNPKATAINSKKNDERFNDVEVGKINSIHNMSHDDKEGDHDETHEKKPHPQYRGKTIFGWVPWVLSLSYETLLNGIPGTGTRNDGLNGTFIKINLDQLVLLRYIAICQRITVFACVICLCIILPINITGGCQDFTYERLNQTIQYDDLILSVMNDDEIFTTSEGAVGTIGTITGCTFGNNSTGYDKTTIINIPSVSDQLCLEAERLGQKSRCTWTQIRLVIIALCTWIISIYTCYVLRKEWKDLLTIRRKYYLEKKEINESLSKYRNHDNRMMNNDHDHNIPAPTKNHKHDPDIHQQELPPYIPHPEMSYTAPNIELYSVLISDIPSDPKDIANLVDLKKSMELARKHNIDWQLAVTATYLDRSIPNQDPGYYTSSVAAITILPSSNQLAKAWCKWNECSRSVRKLQFIRSVIKSKKQQKKSNVSTNNDNENPKDGDPKLLPPVALNNNHNEPTFVVDNDSERFYDTVQVLQRSDSENSNNHKDCTNSSRQENQSAAEDLAYFKSILGLGRHNDDDNAVRANGSDEHFLLEALFDYGPEQISAFAREYARSAAGCCPNGYSNESIILKMTLDELYKEEEDAIENCKESYDALQEARETVRPDFEPINHVDHSPLHTSTTSVLSTTDRQKVVSNSIAINPADSTVGPQQHVLDRQSLSKPKTRPLTMDMIQEAESDMDGDDSNNGQTTFDNDVFATNTAFFSSAEEIIDIKVPRAELNKKEDWGSWKKLTMTTMKHWFQKTYGEIRRTAKMCVTKVPKFTAKKLESSSGHMMSTGEFVYNDIIKETTYAAVTFTSRQAAVAARQCLINGSGDGRWMNLRPLPIPPLADAAVCSCSCRPVAVSIPATQKSYRQQLTVLLLFAFYIFYTIPLSLIQTYSNPMNWKGNFPNITEIVNDSSLLQFAFAALPGLLYTAFIAVCPPIFQAIANSGSGATSLVESEYCAMTYYWWFYNISAFWGSSLASIVIEGWKAGSLSAVGEEFENVITEIAKTIPTTVSSTWLSWMITKALVSWPVGYLLEMNAYIYGFFGMKCLERSERGGGPGKPVPYRIFIDSGIIILCTVALAPTSPLLAPAALLCCLIISPILRWNSVFKYRPNYDAGGIRWPFLSNILIACLFTGHFVLAVVLGLKRSIPASFLAALPIIFIFQFKKRLERQYFRAYQDASLFQTSNSDGWDESLYNTIESREDFRNFLVDSHKAAYVPICVAGNNKSSKQGTITAEPAIVVPLITASHLDTSTANKNTGNLLKHLYSKRQSRSSIRRRRSQAHVA